MWLLLPLLSVMVLEIAAHATCLVPPGAGLGAFNLRGGVFGGRKTDKKTQDTGSTTKSMACELCTDVVAANMLHRYNNRQGKDGCYALACLSVRIDSVCCSCLFPSAFPLSWCCYAVTRLSSVVFGVSPLKVRQIHRDERLRVFEDVTSQIRRVESSGSAPEITLGSSHLDLGDVYYRTVASTVLRVANVGHG